MMLYNDFSANTNSQDLINKLRQSRGSKNTEIEDTPILWVKFLLKKSSISLVNDSKIKDLAYSLS